MKIAFVYDVVYLAKEQRGGFMRIGRRLADEHDVYEWMKK